MDLSTSCMGLELPTPFIGGSCPLWTDLEAVRRLEGAGASAVVLHSLFEEQVMRERLAGQAFHSVFAQRYAAGLEHFPSGEAFRMAPDAYIAHLSRVKTAVRIPVFGSLNGVTPTGWVRYAQRMEEAGADGLELNLYYLPFDPEETSREVEQRYIDIVSFVRQEVRLPLAVKLSPFLSAPLHLGRRLVEAGASALVLFNRFYQPDIDVDRQEVVHTMHLSDPAELLLRLRWVQAMYGQLDASLVVSGGIYAGQDAVKAFLCGADAVQVTSALLKYGPGYIERIGDEVVGWMQAHGETSLAALRGRLSLKSEIEPGETERGEYARLLQGWRSREDG